MSKLRLRFGVLEFEYEGSDEFIKNDLESILKKFSAFLQTHSNSLQVGNSGEKKPDANIPNLGGDLGTVRTIAAKLGVSSGPELIIAAAAFLTFNRKKSTFIRQELTDAMKEATGYFNKNYVNNLSKYLKSLIDDQRFVEVSNEMYAFHQNELKKLGEKLAN